MTDLILVRGIPGSGKSYIAAELAAESDAVVYEADQYFCYRPYPLVPSDKEYTGLTQVILKATYLYEGKRISKAHEWCKMRTRQTLEAGFKVIVSNTFVMVWEMQDYLDMAKELGKSVRVLTATGNYKNVHGVPEEVIKGMKARWEAYGE
jgi:predicted kinase